MKFCDLKEDMAIKIVVDRDTFLASNGDGEVDCTEPNAQIWDSVQKGSTLEVVVVLHEDNAFIIATDDSTYYFAAHEASMFKPA